MKRAILWCGQIRRAVNMRNSKGRVEERGDFLLPLDDFTIQANGLELAFRAALALGVPASEIYACLVRDDLRPPELGTPVLGATLADLQRLASRISKKSTTADALLFVAVNHGSTNGLATAQAVVDEFDDDCETILTPNALGECLDTIRGMQVLVLSTCYSGTFLPLGKPDARLVLTACSADEVHFIGRGDEKWCSFLDMFFGAWCGCSLSDAVPRSKSPPTEAFETAKQRLKAAAFRSSPMAAGSIRWPSES